MADQPAGAGGAVVVVLVSAGAVDGVATDVDASGGATVSSAADVVVGGAVLTAPWTDFWDEQPAAIRVAMIASAMVRGND